MANINTTSEIEGQNDEFTTTYPLNGKKIKRLTKSDITVFKVNYNCYEFKVVNKDNIFITGGTPFGTRKIKKEDGLYTRVMDVSKKLRYDLPTIHLTDSLNTIKEIVNVFNGAIDWLENYASFLEKDMDNILKDE